MRLNKVRTGRIRRMKAEGQKIVMLTAYDCFMARVLDEAGVELVHTPQPRPNDTVYRMNQ